MQINCYGVQLESRFTKLNLMNELYRQSWTMDICNSKTVSEYIIIHTPLY